MEIMPEDAFGTLERLLESENPSSSFDLLIGQFRAAKDYRSLFEARLMRKRLELGLPLCTKRVLDLAHDSPGR